VYKGLDVLTAKPTAGEQAAIPHHLFSIIPLSESFSAAQYEKRARACLASIAARGGLAIVTGGTGLYIKALTHGLSPLPEADPSLRAGLAALPPATRVAWLRSLDPAGAARTDLANPRYVQRALEIVLQTGRPVSTLASAWNEPPPDGAGIFLARDRADLYDRINRRARAMFERGLLDEVGALAPIALSSTAEKAIGIREARRHLAGEIGLEACIAAIQQATRRYAKRQITWFKREKWLRPLALSADETPDAAAERILDVFPGIVNR
jgi:tRNA dimethylallyltransferase